MGLTVLIMLALTPVTIKSTKSMIAMQRLQPEMKKLQAKYKGPENREILNQEMMKLYKDNGTSPFGACLPSLLQMPFLIVLYSLIRGLSNAVPKGQTDTNGAGRQSSALQHLGCAEPLYIRQAHKCNKHGGQSWPNALVVRHGFVVPSFVDHASLEAPARQCWCSRIWCSLALRCSCSTTK